MTKFLVQFTLSGVDATRWHLFYKFSSLETSNSTLSVIHLTGSKILLPDVNYDQIRSCQHLSNLIFKLDNKKNYFCGSSANSGNAGNLLLLHKKSFFFVFYFWSCDYKSEIEKATRNLSAEILKCVRRSSSAKCVAAGAAPDNHSAAHHEETILPLGRFSSLSVKSYQIQSSISGVLWGIVFISVAFMDSDTWENDNGIKSERKIINRRSLWLQLFILSLCLFS